MPEPGELESGDLGLLTGAMYGFIKRHAGEEVSLRDVCKNKHYVKAQAGLTHRYISEGCWQRAWGNLLGVFPELKLVRGVGDKNLVFRYDHSEKESKMESQVELRNATGKDVFVIANELVSLINSKGPMDVSLAMTLAATRVGLKISDRKLRANIGNMVKSKARWGDRRLINRDGIYMVCPAEVHVSVVESDNIIQKDEPSRVVDSSRAVPAKTGKKAKGKKDIAQGAQGGLVEIHDGILTLMLSLGDLPVGTSFELNGPVLIEGTLLDSNLPTKALLSRIKLTITR